MPSIIIAKKLGLDKDQIKAALKTFKGLEHRLEFVKNINGVEYYNDSLATNPQATMAALDAFQDKNVILIAGGYDRNLDYSQLSEKISELNIKKLVLFPDTGEKILQTVKTLQCNVSENKSYIFVDNMPDAVNEASKIASSGDVVLLSPASASFNMFKDYADRGNQFKAEVKKLI